MASDSTVIGKYRAGFSECAGEVSRYLQSIDGLDPTIRGRLLQHLNDCTHKLAAMQVMQDQQSMQQQLAASNHQVTLKRLK